MMNETGSMQDGRLRVEYIEPAAGVVFLTTTAARETIP